MTFPVEELGSAAVETLCQIQHGQDVPRSTTVYAKPIIRCSCGCTEEHAPASYRLLGRKNRMLVSLEQSILSITNLSFSMQTIDDIDDVCDLIADYLLAHNVCQEFYLCLYADWNQLADHVDHILRLTDGAEDAPSSDTILLKLGIRDGKRLPEGEFQKTSLLPPQIAKTTCYTFIPLYFGTKVFGYAAVFYAPQHSDYYFHSLQLLMQISGLLHGILEKTRTGQLVRRLEHIYLRDPLTGLLNKYGFDQSTQALIIDAKELDSMLCCFVVDMKNQRAIIEAHGHREGDFALQVVSQAIKRAQKPEDIAARFSGDEFYVLGIDYTKEDADEFVKDIRAYLKNYNTLSTKQYEITCNIGYVIFTADEISDTAAVYDMFAATDQKKYEEGK